MAPDAARSSAKSRLYARAPLGIKLGLDTLREVSARAGRPETAFAAVHLAGTNGKGSTAAMIAEVCRRAGMRTGLYTSPHLCRFAERIQIDGAPLGDAPLEAALDRALTLGPELSFFEAATLAAFLAFRDAGVEIAIVEAGLGGRLDATNILPAPRCTAVTSIGMDHMDQLGGTLVEIAREKAHIAKPGAPMILGPMPEEARDAISEIAARVGVTPVATDAAAARARLLPELARRDPGLSLALRGAHQLDNARVADLVCAALALPEGTRREGIAAARWPGRLELVDTAEGAVLLDGAHNEDGAAALAKALAEGAHGGERAHGPGETALVFGAVADKAVEAVLARLLPRARSRVFVAPRARAAHDPAALAERHGGSAAASVEVALARARAAVGADGLVVVTGSLYLVGEARALLLDLPSDPPVGL